ncbi:MAG TPA: chemotaxis-specific protein-glutamate methyltransferase CheB [Rhodocyclaceae bacterium]|nr:chemotaxis-specific protein-glutamate methyltransferase CheB [Rhodocyclaceae bacterium]
MSVIRVVIADDSVLARELLRSILESEEGIQVVGEACNGREAVELVHSLKPDILTIDLEMPVMGGMEAIEEIMASKAVPILVVSSVADAHNALEAVRRGALDAVAKPDLDPVTTAGFVAKVRMLAQVRVITHLRPRKALAEAVVPAATAAAVGTTATATVATMVTNAPLSSTFQRIVAIASSTGGPQALAQIFAQLPANFPFPIVIAQHISDGFAGGMADWLGTLCRLPVRLGQEGESIQSGTIYLSPSERNMAVTPTRRLTLMPRGERDLYHPTCDVLLESVAAVFGPMAIGVILTGMGHDGAAGMAAIRKAGGVTLGQDQSSSVIYGMNQIAIDNGAVEKVLPLAEIAGNLLRLTEQDGAPKTAW